MQFGPQNALIYRKMLLDVKDASTALCATENEVGVFGVSFAREMSLCMQFHFLCLAHATSVGTGT